MGFYRSFLLHSAVGLSTLAIIGVLRSQDCAAQLLQGTIDGNVTDVSQAAVSGATVAVTNQGTTLHRETVTNSLGEYAANTSSRHLQSYGKSIRIWRLLTDRHYRQSERGHARQRFADCQPDQPGGHGIGSGREPAN